LEVIKKYKFFTVKKGTSNLDISNQVYYILNNRTNFVLGWYPTWRQFVFQANDAIWSDDCLRDVTDAITLITERKKMKTVDET